MCNITTHVFIAMALLLFIASCRSTPSFPTTITEYPVPTYGIAPEGIAARPDGNLWFTARGQGGLIGRITLSGGISEFLLPTPESDP